MCLAVPGEIKEVFDNEAKVWIMGVETIVNIQLIENPEVGEYVLIHAGCAIEKIDKDYFDDLLSMFKNIINEDEKIDG